MVDELGDGDVVTGGEMGAMQRVGVRADQEASSASVSIVALST
jgi:hypothetical protein